MKRDNCRKTVKRKYRISSRYRMQLEFNFSEYLVGKCRFTTSRSFLIRTQKISLTLDGIVFSDTIPLSWFTSSFLIPWSKISHFTILDKIPLIDGVVCTPWSSDLTGKTVDFQYATLGLSDPPEMTIDLPWSTAFTETVKIKNLFDLS